MGDAQIEVLKFDGAIDRDGGVEVNGDTACISSSGKRRCC